MNLGSFVDEALVYFLSMKVKSRSKNVECGGNLEQQLWPMQEFQMRRIKRCPNGSKDSY